MYIRCKHGWDPQLNVCINQRNFKIKFLRSKKKKKKMIRNEWWETDNHILSITIGHGGQEGSNWTFGINNSLINWGHSISILIIWPVIWNCYQSTVKYLTSQLASLLVNKFIYMSIKLNWRVKQNADITFNVPYHYRLKILCIPSQLIWPMNEDIWLVKYGKLPVN